MTDKSNTQAAANTSANTGGDAVVCIPFTRRAKELPATPHYSSSYGGQWSSDWCVGVTVDGRIKPTKLVLSASAKEALTNGEMPSSDWPFVNWKNQAAESFVAWAYVADVRAALAAQPTPEPVAHRCRDLSDADMDQIAGWLGELERGDIGYHALCGKIIASFVEPVAQARWCAAVGELLGHLSDVLSDETFDLIDTAKWNAVSALVGTHETARPPVALQERDEPIGIEDAMTVAQVGLNTIIRRINAGNTAGAVEAAEHARQVLARASLPAGGVVEPSNAQLQQIIDGLTRCHANASKTDFLRSWIRDWTQHKGMQSTIATPQPSETQGRRQMTDDEITTVAARHLGEMHVENCGLGDIKAFARSIEAHHGIPASPQDGGANG